MAHPLFVADQVMRNFIGNWLSGLKPTLCLSTNEDGSISVKLEVVSSPLIVPPADNVSRLRPRRRSGRNSRLRRRKERKIRSNLTSTELSEVNSSDCQPSHISQQIEAVSATDCSSPEKPVLSTTKVSSVDIEPKESKIIPELSIVRQSSLSIPPRTIHHPAVINACFAILGKHPSTLSQEEVYQFQQYREFKESNGDPIEENVVYLPIGGVRTCLHCNQPT